MRDFEDGKHEVEVRIKADTEPAKVQIDGLWQEERGRDIQIPVKVDKEAAQASTEQFLSGERERFKKGGEDAGKEFGGGIGEGTNSTKPGFLSKFKDYFSGVTEEAAGEGDKAGLSMGSAMPVAIGAAIVAGAPLIAGALTGATVIGLVAVGALLHKGDPAIAAGIQGLVGSLKDEMTKATAVMVTPIARGLNQIQGFLQSEAPMFDSLFRGAAADIPILVGGIDSLVGNALPGLNNMVSNSQPIMQGLASLLGSIGTGIGDIASGIAADSSTIGGDLTHMGQDVRMVTDTLSNLITIGSDLFNILGPVFDAFFAGLFVISTGIKDVVGWIKNLADSGDQAAPKLSATAQAAKDLAEATAPMPPIFASATTNARQLGADITKMGSASVTASSEISTLQDAVKTLADDGLAKANDFAATFFQTLTTLAGQLATAKGGVATINGQLNLTSAAGRDINTAVDGARNAMIGYADSAINAGVPTSQVTAQLGDMASKLEQELLPAFHHNRAAVDAYLTSIGLVPKQLVTDVSAPGAITSTDQMLGLMQQIHNTPKSHSVTVSALTASAMSLLRGLGLTVRTLPNGKVVITANTAPARQDVSNFIAAEQGRTIFIPIRGVGNPATGQPILGPFHVGGHASGGDMPANVPTLVGEQGPELIFPGRSGFVATANQTHSIMSELANRINGGGGASAAQIASAVASAVYGALHGATLRVDGNGVARLVNDTNLRNARR